jgi:hypothetical protein
MIDITSTIQDAIKRIQSLPGKIERAGSKTLKAAAETVTRIMKRPGKKRTYPIDWDSPAQQRKVMAMLRARGELPYVRKGGYIGAWMMRQIEGGYSSENIGHAALFMAGAPSGEFPGAVHVTPSGQSHIHAGTWQPIRPVLDAVLARLPADLVDDLKVEVSQ